MRYLAQPPGAAKLGVVTFGRLVAGLHRNNFGNILAGMNITPTELKLRLDRGDKLRVIDVREADEWTIAQIPNAELIPLSEFQQRGPAEIEPSEDVVLYCHHGVRSGRAQAFLKAQGYGKVLNLTGGIDAWAMQVDPSMKKY
jgi:adenylyltransferase/sulfurtransferase